MPIIKIIYDYGTYYILQFYRWIKYSMDKLYTIYTSPPTNYIVYYKVLKKYRTNYVIRLLLGFYTFHTTTFTVEVFGEERAYKYAFPSGPLYIEIGPKRSLNYAPPPPSLYCSHHHICVYVQQYTSTKKRGKKKKQKYLTDN